MEMMGLSTAELLECVHQGGHLEVTETKLTRWKHQRFIESHRPGRGRGRGRGPARWDEGMCGTICAIAHFLQAKRNLGTAALAAWLAGNPMPLPTVRRLLIRSGERWLDPLPLSAALPTDLPQSESVARVPQGQDDLDAQITFRADKLASESDMLMGIPHRYRLSLVRHAVRVALGLATEPDLRDAAGLLSKIAPDLEKWLRRELPAQRDLTQFVAPFSVAVIRRTIAGATDEKLIQARTAYRSNLPYVVLLGVFELLLLSAQSRIGPDVGLALAAFQGMQNPAYALTGLLLERTRT